MVAPTLYRVIQKFVAFSLLHVSITFSNINLSNVAELNPEVAVQLTD